MSVSAAIPLKGGLIIRPIQASDNQQLAQLISQVWAEFDDATTYFDDPEAAAGSKAHRQNGLAELPLEMQPLNQLYQVPDGQPVDRGYWVIADETQRILGGGGFAALIGPHPDAGICELQKLYFHPDVRGQGLGRYLMTLILEQATQAGYREMYLESILEMAGAICLYEKFGFQWLTERKGSTGHWRCTVFMSRPLTPTH
jgi:putative acetyltransferase